MNAEEIRILCLQKSSAYEDYPFGEEPACFRVQGRIFAELYPSPARLWITFKCEPMRADFYRSQYPDVVVRGYHCPPVQQPYNNTVSYEKIEDDILLEMLDHSYTRALASLPKYIQRELAEGGKHVSQPPV